MIAARQMRHQKQFVTSGPVSSVTDVLPELSADPDRVHRIPATVAAVKDALQHPGVRSDPLQYRSGAVRAGVQRGGDTAGLVVDHVAVGPAELVVPVVQVDDSTVVELEQPPAVVRVTVALDVGTQVAGRALAGGDRRDPDPGGRGRRTG